MSWGQKMRRPSTTTQDFPEVLRRVEGRIEKDTWYDTWPAVTIIQACSATSELLQTPSPSSLMKSRCHQSRVCCWGDPVSNYNWRVDRHCWAIWEEMAISTLLWCSGWQACGGHLSLEYWLYVQKLQGLLLHCPHCPGRRRLQFLWIDVGSDGSSNDASIYKGSELKKDLENPNNIFNLPLPGDALLSHTT